MHPRVRWFIRTITSGVAVATAVGTLGACPAMAGSTTTITMRVTGCEGCVFIAHNGKRIRSAWKVVSKSTPVVEGKATLVVPRRQTRWISFEVDHPLGYTEWNASAFVATRPMTGKMKGSWDLCWNKQAGSTARLNVVVTEYRDRVGIDDPISTFIHARLAKLPPKASIGVNGTPGCWETYKRLY